MDFLDPRKERITQIALFVGYGLIALAIGIASIILLYQTDGYCVDGTGTVDRCGLVFISSQPTGADVRIDGKLKKAQTNTKFNLQSGTYNVRLSRQGYREWARNITVSGGDVQRFDYPFLFPDILNTSTVASYTNQIQLTSQSPNRRWLLMSETAPANTFKLYDAKNAAKPTVSTLSFPDGLVTASDSATNTWTVVQWSDDNRHILLQHNYTANKAAAQEYILLDRQNTSSSRNVTKDLNLKPVEQLSLFNEKPNDYYVYDTQAKTLRTAALDGSAPTSNQLNQVLAYKTYSDDTILYVTDTPPSGKKIDGYVSVVLQQGTRSIVLRRLPVGATKYLLDIAQYSNDWYIVLGSDTLSGAYIYMNPFDQRLVKTTDLPLPIRYLKVAQPQYVSFSTNTQFIMAENGQHIAVYDAENDKVYNYVTNAPLDAPQQHATWMDGDRMYYVSGGKVLVFDYDNLNQQLLQPALPAFLPVFSSDYTYMYNMQQADAGNQKLVMTALQVKN